MPLTPEPLRAPDPGGLPGLPAAACLEFPLPTQAAARLVGEIFRATHPKNYRVKAYKIWDYLENNARACANTTNSLPVFYDSLHSRMGATVPHAADTLGDTSPLTALAGVIGADKVAARPILRALRDETATVVLLVRLEQAERKARRDALPLSGRKPSTATPETEDAETELEAELEMEETA